MAQSKPTPRKKYNFVELKKGDTISILLRDPLDGARAARAAYAYGRRNNKKFCTLSETKRGRDYMTIRRYA